MAKKIIQDIIVNKDPKGIKTSVCVVSEIKEATNKKKVEDTPIWVSQKKRGEDVFLTSFSSSNSSPEKINNRGRKFLWFLAVSLVIVVIFLISTMFSTAEITVYPKSVSVDVNNDIKISKSPLSTGLPYEIIQIEKTLSKSVEPDGEEQVSIKAVGKAFIYNEYSTSNQRFIINTRLESSDGLIYKIKQSADVPGYRMEGNKKIPGRVEVEIIADEAGEKYNMKVSDLKGDFTIPGLKEIKTKYKDFYARLSSDVIGGYVGPRKIVSEDKKKEYKDTLRDMVRTELVKDFASNLPKGYITFDSLKEIDFDENISGIVSVDNTLSEKGILKALVFNEEKIASYIESLKELVNEDNGTVYPVFPEDFSVTVKGDAQNLWDKNELIINLSGSLKIVRKIDEEKLKNFISGVRKSTVGVLISSQFPNDVEKTSIIVSPQWNLSLPKKAENIKVRVVLE